MTEKNTDINMSTEHIMQHNVYVKKMSFPEKDTVYCGHHHDYDHVTMVTKGRVRVKFLAVPEAGIDEEVKEYSAVETFVTRSFREHEITTLEPETVVCCIHAIREENGNPVVPEVPSEHLHDPDYKFHSWEKVSAALKDKKIQRRAFTATLEDKHKMIVRAEKEGTLVAGSGDMLLND